MKRKQKMPFGALNASHIVKYIADNTNNGQELVDILLKCAREAHTEELKNAAAKVLFERMYGKPSASVQVGVTAQVAPAPLNIDGLSDDELRILQTALARGNALESGGEDDDEET